MPYPQETNWQAWMTFDTPAHAAINPDLRGRLAAYIRDVIKRKVAFAAGFRSRAEQQILWDRYKAGAGNLAAMPGTSWHEFGFACDVNNPAQYAPLAADYKLPPAQQAMRAYGICIPLWAGSTSKEPWHIQPIETLGYTGDKAAFRLEEVMQLNDNNPQVGSWQMALDAAGYWPAGVAHNTNFGPTTAKCTNDFKRANGLSEDGVVDATTWAAMTETLRKKADVDLHACQALETAQAEQLRKLQADLADYTTLKFEEQKITEALRILAARADAPAT